jgi:hypothetical protein
MPKYGYIGPCSNKKCNVFILFEIFNECSSLIRFLQAMNHSLKVISGRDIS